MLVPPHACPVVGSSGMGCPVGSHPVSCLCVFKQCVSCCRCAAATLVLAPRAAGSGVPELRTVLSGDRNLVDAHHANGGGFLEAREQ